MRGIPAKGAIPPAVRQRETAARRSRQPTGQRGVGLGTKPCRGRAGYFPIKTWTFEEKPTFRRLSAKLHVRRVDQPDVEVHQEVKQVVVIANLPGVRRADLDIDVHGDIMAIEAKRKHYGEVHHYHRELLLPVEVHDIPIGVAFENGLLEVRLKPKAVTRKAGKGHGKTSRR